MLLKFVSTLWEIRIPSLVLGMSSRVQGLCALTRGSFSCRLPISGRCRAGLLMTRTMVSGGPARVRGVDLSHSPAPGLLFVFLCCVSTCNDQPWHFFSCCFVNNSQWWWTEGVTILWWPWWGKVLKLLCSTKIHYTGTHLNYLVGEGRL